MTITYKLLFRYLYNFLFIHAFSMQSFWTSNTLIYRHSISTNSTSITIVKWTSKMHWVSVYVFEQFLSIISLYAFRMIKFCAICSRTFSQFIFFLTIFYRRIIFSYNFFLIWTFTWFRLLFSLFNLLPLFSLFFAFFIFSSIIISLSFTN